MNDNGCMNHIQHARELADMGQKKYNIVGQEMIFKDRERDLNLQQNATSEISQRDLKRVRCFR